MVAIRTSHSVPELNTRRHKAVALRLEGAKLAAIAQATGLSVPTIIAAHKAYLNGGWGAVDTAPRGRPRAGLEYLSADTESTFLHTLLHSSPSDENLSGGLWNMGTMSAWIKKKLGLAGVDLSLNKAISRLLLQHRLIAPPLLHQARKAKGYHIEQWLNTRYPALQQHAKTEGNLVLWGGERSLPGTTVSGPRGASQLYAHTTRGSQLWLATQAWPQAKNWIQFFDGLCHGPDRKIYLITQNQGIAQHPLIASWLAEHSQHLELIMLPADWGFPPAPVAAAATTAPFTKQSAPLPPAIRHTMSLTHLQQLEAESIHIMREVVAETANPVMLYSIGKDSAVMLHLAMKAFFPALPPFPLLHVDTRWKFRDMYAMRDRVANETGLKLLVHINPEGIEKDINPFTHGSAIHTDIMKTQGLKQALDKYGFDAAFGGARRDEEKSRAKERIFSFRSAQHRWDPKHQRPELWKLYNTRMHKGESIRVFPLSNWTELDIWQYIYLENIPIVPLYYAAVRPVVERNGTLIMVDDDRMPLKPGEVPMMKKVRFRTLGCYPLTGAFESEADTLPAIIQEMLLANTSERQGRVIDHDGAASMEKKKQEGYF